MIVKHNDDFFIQWDIVYKIDNNQNLGIFNFWINDICYPAKGINITLESLFYIMDNNISEIKNLKKELGDIPIKEIDFNIVDGDEILFLDTGELFQFGFGLAIGFNKNNERIFYTNDFENTYSEIVVPKGMLLNTLFSLKNSYEKIL